MKASPQKDGETDKDYQKRIKRNATVSKHRRSSEKHKQYEREYSKKRYERLKELNGGKAPYKELSVEQKKKKQARMRLWRKNNMPHLLNYNKMWRIANGLARPSDLSDGIVRPTGSVLICAAPSEFRDALDAITKATPWNQDRDEIIAEAAMLFVQGLDVESAVKQAKKNVSKRASFYRYSTKNIDDCFWI